MHNTCGVVDHRLLVSTLLTSKYLLVKHEFDHYEWHVIVYIDMQYLTESHSHAPNNAQSKLKSIKRRYNQTYT